MSGTMVTQSASPDATFAKVMANYHSKYSEAGPSSAQLDSPIRYDVVLDEEGGMISALMNSLEETLRAQRNSGGISPEVFESLMLEHRTWALIRTVYENRLHRADPEFVPPSSEEQIAQNPYTPPEAAAQTIVNEDSELSLWATLLDHLQSRPLFSSPPPIEARHGYLPSTLRKVKKARLDGKDTPSLDPDFTLRDPHGQALAGEDETYQTPLLETLWDLVRHGELDQAVTVCDEGGEPWRAASLMGGRRWNMGGITKENPEATALTGNRSRALWKKSCRAIAKNHTLSQAERALYAALIADLPTLLPACESWEDYLWAHIQYRLEARIDRKWHSLGGFWEQEDALIGNDDEGATDVGRGGLDEVFASLASVQSGSVAAASQNPYYVAQKMVILGRAPVLPNTFADRLPTLADSVAPDLIGPLVRFFTHFVLVLRSLGQDVPEDAANDIIKAYLHILEREGNDALVAAYAACLREGNGEQSYARFLRAMDPDAPFEQKKQALLRAQQHNLDISVIAKETVRMILDEAFSSIPALIPGEPEINWLSSLSERDVHLIRAIEWLTMVPDTLGEALVRSNDVMRYFLALGQANAAHALLRSLPSQLEGIRADDETQSDEHHDYVRLFQLFSAHDAVDEAAGRAPKETAGRVEQHNWAKKLNALIDDVAAQTRSLLTSSWLQFPAQGRSLYASQRRKELARIRQIFIPYLVLRLHQMLVQYSDRTPRFLQDALEMASLVAAEDWRVYDEFVAAGSLERYLERMREASMLALKRGSTDAFVVRQ